MNEPQMMIYTANCMGNVANCVYPNEIAITDENSAKKAFSNDTVYAKYKGNYRSIDNFLYADVIPADCDNDHSDNEKEWITESDIAEMFPNVKYILHYSRNHMKQKGNLSPQPRFHVIFSIERTEDELLYSNLKSNLIALYPFFDDGAKDSTRFMFGTQDPQVIFHLGSETLSSFLKEIEDEKDFAEMGMVIPEGSRNTTMSRIAAKIIKRYGDTNEAKSKFFEMATQCSPPLDDELEKIWQGKQNFYKKISSQIGYVAPDKYNNTEPIEWETPIPFQAYTLPTFPTEALPEVIQKYVLAVSESTQTSPDMAAVEAIGITSLCVQGKYNICGNADWKEPLNTYIVVILPPAERKSSVLSMMTSPVETYETEKNTELSAEIIESGMMLDKLEKEKRALALHLSVNTVRSHIRRHPLPNTVIVSCKQCGKNIVQSKETKSKKFCSDSCRNAWWNTHQDTISKKAFYHITCEQCRKEFDSYGNKNREYCSRTCYGNARRTHSL